MPYVIPIGDGGQRALRKWCAFVDASSSERSSFQPRNRCQFPDISVAGGVRGHGFLVANCVGWKRTCSRPIMPCLKPMLGRVRTAVPAETSCWDIKEKERMLLSNRQTDPLPKVCVGSDIIG